MVYSEVVELLLELVTVLKGLQEDRHFIASLKAVTKDQFSTNLQGCNGQGEWNTCGELGNFASQEHLKRSGLIKLEAAQLGG